MICAYCNAETDNNAVPGVCDDDSWQERAHRIEPVTFGQAMRLARQAHGLTQAELGKTMGMLVPAISRCERDGSTISEPTMHRLAAALGEPLSAIIARAELAS